MAWSSLTVILKAATPLSFRATRDPQRGAGVDFLPGPSLFGALAGAHRLIRPGEVEEFTALFGRDGIRVSNGYPLEQPGPVADAAVLARPVPVTAITCKRAPGFARPQPDNGNGRPEDEHHEKDAPHGVADRLLALGAFALSGRLDSAPLEDLAVCRAVGEGPDSGRGGGQGRGAGPGHPCGQPTDSQKGFAFRDAAGRWQGTRAKMGSLVRVGISDLTGTSEPEVLYSLPTLAEGSRFGVEFTGEAERLASLKDFLEEACAEPAPGDMTSGPRRLPHWVLRVGTNRTRGCGALMLATRGEIRPAPEDQAGLRERLETFDRRFRDLCRGYGIDTPAPFYFAVTLLSDTIIPDGALRYALRLDPPYLGLRGPAADTSGGTPGGSSAPISGGAGLSLVCHSATTRRVHGWSPFWRMPKPDEMAIGMGSAFLYACPGPLSDEMLSGLAALEMGGLGVRRQQGFGRVAVSDRFHWELGGSS